MSLALGKRHSKSKEQKSELAPKRTRERERQTPVGVSETTILQLESVCPCSGGCPRCQSTLQKKLKVRPHDDAYEDEADTIAKQLMDLQKPLLEFHPISQIDTLRTRPLASRISSLPQEWMRTNASSQHRDDMSSTNETDFVDRIHVKHGGGRQLNESERSFFEPRFGHDFSKVRLHADSESGSYAHILNAQAFTQGQDIFWGRGIPRPGTNRGDHLLAHELTHVVQQDQAKSFQPDAEGKHVRRIQRKLLIQSQREANDFKWFLTPNDARYFRFSRKKAPYEVRIAKRVKGRIADPFRFNVLKTIIENPNEVLLIRHWSMDKKLPPIDMYQNGRLSAKGVQPTLRELGDTVLGAGGITIPSRTFAFRSDSSYSGPVTTSVQQSWICYSEVSAIAHELAGHAFLIFSGTFSGHEEVIPASAGVKTPEGEPYEGKVIDFIEKYAEERFVDVPPFFEEKMKSLPHLSPTHVRKWPEPPDQKKTFTGTWLEYKKKYPKAKLVKRFVGKGKRKRPVIAVCNPGWGEICL